MEQSMNLSLPELMAATPAMREIFGARGGVAAMLRVESALAHANAGLGLIPAAAAAAIASACTAADIDIEQLAAEGALAGTVVIPLVAWLQAKIPEYAGFVHQGGTSQDVIDTALMLQLQDGLRRLDTDLAAMATSAAALASVHAATPILARTLMQPALPSSFGLKAAYWLAMLDDARLALRAAGGDALAVQCGGAAGTLDGFGQDAAAFTTALAARLELAAPALPWQTRRGPLARLGCAVAAAIGTLGKIAGDVVLMMQAELHELNEPAAPGRGGSSAMAHKRNPTLSIQIRAAALRAPHLAATLLAAIPQEHERAAGAWQAEQSVWPQLMGCASGAFAAAAELLHGLEINTAAMATNLGRISAAPASAAIPDMISRALAAHAKISEGFE
jgi:3-carboxy-cis,cis-muconate cycloisomerase